MNCSKSITRHIITVNNGYCIYLNKSPKWIDGNIMISNKLISNIMSDKNNKIELKTSIQPYSYTKMCRLYINDAIYFEANYISKFNLILNLISDDKDDIFNIIKCQEDKNICILNCKN